MIPKNMIYLVTQTISLRYQKNDTNTILVIRYISVSKLYHYDINKTILIHTIHFDTKTVSLRYTNVYWDVLNEPVRFSQCSVLCLRGKLSFPIGPLIHWPSSFRKLNIQAKDYHDFRSRKTQNLNSYHRIYDRSWFCFLTNTFFYA